MPQEVSTICQTCSREVCDPLTHCAQAMHAQFAVDAFLDCKPMQIFQDWSHVIRWLMNGELAEEARWSQLEDSDRRQHYGGPTATALERMHTSWTVKRPDRSETAEV